MFFNKKKEVNKIEELRQESNSIFNVFKQTLSGLTENNSKVDEEISQREEKIEMLQQENLALELIKQDNDKLISKISDFLN